MARMMGEHPDEILTAAYIDGSLAPEIRDAVESHLAECRSCRAGVVLLRSPDSSLDERVPAEIVSEAIAASRIEEPEEPWTYRLITALAAAIVIAAALGLWFSTTTPPSAREVVAYRGTESSPFGVLSPAPGSRVAPEGIVFGFSRVAGADRYEVIVLGVGGAPVATIETGASAAPVRWPAGTPLPPRGTLLYRVRALALDRVLAESRAIPFEVR
jgi:hypothetical protein